VSSKQAYRKFLKSDFWKELSTRKRRSAGRCEGCGSRRNLQSHHWRYPEDWYATTEADLKVLCRGCHAKVHGIVEVRSAPFMLYREDYFFSAMMHRLHCLKLMIYSGRGLRERDKSFLEWAMKWYPPEPKDTAVKFHVGQVWLTQSKFEKGMFA